LWVFGGHLFGWQIFYPGGMLLNQFATTWLISFNPGHLGVLFFFILSGYVMGIAYPHDKEFLWKKYLLKRLIRIWPMYAIAVVISCVIVPASLWQFMGHLLFLNPDIVPAISGNTVLWSVSYEFGFYLVFPLIFQIGFLHKNKATSLLIGVILISIISHLFEAIRLWQLFSWINGLLFWLIGLVIAWRTKPQNDRISKPMLYHNILPGIFIAVALNSAMKGFIAILKIAGFPNPSPTFTPTIGDLLYLPAILPVFLILIHAKIPRRVELTLFLVSFLQVFVVVSGSIMRGTFLIFPEYSSAMLLAFIAIVLKIKPVNFDLTILAPIGSLSYGIYIYHMPITHLIAKISLLGGGWIEWYSRLVITISMVLIFAYLIEIKLQPKIRDFFLKFL
jgi:peptidoglycan/LPS O-acetylase OafA/YrhL